MKFSRLFITGCDQNTEWQLPWFIERFKRHNPDEKLVVFNFGSHPFQYPVPNVSLVKEKASGWFKKPAAMLKSSTMAEKVCWLDTDCEVRGPISDVFDKVVKNKLAMVEDVPWTRRRGEKWHNSGVVAFESQPVILGKWVTAIRHLGKVTNPMFGDQDVLHGLTNDPMLKLMHITDLPREYNTLRLDFQDGTAPMNPKIVHWTGKKGKEVIKEQMKNG
jgi:hypothetical protein